MQDENIKYILFDLDGTLTDPKEGITKCFQYALHFFGVEEEKENLTKVIGPPLKDSFMEFYGLDEEDAFIGVAKYRERFQDIGIFENEIYDGIKDLLADLKSEGYLLGVASSKPTVFVERICNYFEIRSYFSHITGSFLDGRRSQKADVLTDAINEFKDVDKNRIIMVGDRKYDVEGAHSCGIKCIGVEYGYGLPGELKEAGADFIVDSVPQLASLLLQGR